ncbi:D-alanyl-D-alanine carboxypeptidase [Streptomyces noursei]|uniref:D-alanyl-D-alanine carboxypeptidase n=1 Tax=Streptomyces noursei TaxID=1971 RepID=UPI0035D58B04
MAGESPDKSDKKSGKEQSSGETARTERDPRLSILRDERGNRGGAEKAGNGSGDGGAGKAPKEGASGNGNGTPEAETSGAKASETKPSGAKAAGAKSSDVGDAEASEAKASGAEKASPGKGASGTAKPDASGQVSAEADGAETAEKPEEAPEAAQAAAEGDAEGEGKAKAGAGRVKAGASADAKAGAAEEKAPAAPEKSGASGKSAEESASGKPAASEEKGASGEKGAPADDAEDVDRATAVFKTMDPKGAGESAEEEPADDATRVFAVAKSAKAAKTAKAAKSEASEKEAAERPADQPTAVFKLGTDTDPKAGDAKKADGDGAEAAAKAGGKADEKSAAKADAKKADEKPAAKDAGAKAKGAAAVERDAERTSQFVALKSSDDGSAERSIGKTAPKAPLGKPGGAADDADKGQEKAADEAADKAGDKTAGKTGDKTADKDAAAGGKSGGKTGGKSGDASDKAPEKGSGKAPGAMPAAAPAKPDGKPDAGAAAPAASASEADAERTRQEPLPPLDLLAKLTNTPPPPETPMRTVVRRFKIWTPLAVLLVIVFMVVQAVRPLPAPTLVLGDAKSSFTFAGGKLSIPWPEQGQAAVKVVGSGEVGTFGEQKSVPTASVAKIMTAYVILRDHPLKDKNDKGPQIQVDDKAVQEGNSESESRIAGLKAGQKFTEQDMLKMLMIPSGNNIARLLARWDTQSADEAAFVKKMNAAAKDLGMTKTTYTDPSGLDPKTVSTAVDQIKLAEAVMKFDAFRPIVAMPNAEIPGLPERINNNNDNLLLAGLSVKGIKTGSSTAAGGALSWAAYKTVDGKDRLILGTMMDQHFKGLDPNAANSLTLVKDNSKKVIEAVRDALDSATAVQKGQVVGYVDDGLGTLTPVVATKDLKAVGVPGQQLQLSVGGDGKTIPHEAAAGTVVGELTVGNGASQQKVPVALQSALSNPSFGAKLTRLG